MANEVSIKFNPSWYKKTDHNTIKQCIAKTIKDTTLEAEKRCKSKAPVDTGNLMRSHSSQYEENEGSVHNSADYWSYVVFGTCKMAARNYPEQVCKELGQNKYMSNRMKEYIASEMK